MAVAEVIDTMEDLVQFVKVRTRQLALPVGRFYEFSQFAGFESMLDEGVP